MLIGTPWLGLLATVPVFVVMWSLGLGLGLEPVVSLRSRLAVLVSVIFAVAVVVVVTALAVVLLHASAVSGPVAVGSVLMVISPGAPVALRRALDAGGNRDFAPALHRVIVMLAVLTVPATVAILDRIFAVGFVVTPRHIGRQVFFAQVLPLALGAACRAVQPRLAAQVRGPLARRGNGLLLVLLVGLLVDLPDLLAIGIAMPQPGARGGHGQRAGLCPGAEHGAHRLPAVAPIALSALYGPEARHRVGLGRRRGLSPAINPSEDHDG